MPPTVPFNHYFDLVKTNEKDRSPQDFVKLPRHHPAVTLLTHLCKDQSPILLSHANICKAFYFITACFEDSILFKVKRQEFY